MTLQASGAISIGDIADEFGGNAPHALSEYYRGGGLVQNTTQNAGIPSSGAIKLSDFYGATKATLSAGAGGTFTDTTASAALVTLTLRTDGLAQISTQAGVQSQWTWCDPADAGNVYAFITVNSGGFSIGDSTGAWVELGDVERSWSVVSTGDPVTANFDLSLGFGASGPAVVTETYDFTADAS